MKFNNKNSALESESVEDVIFRPHTYTQTTRVNAGHRAYTEKLEFLVTTNFQQKPLFFVTIVLKAMDFVYCVYVL